MARFTGGYKRAGPHVANASAALVNYGELLLGQLAERQRLGAPPTLSIRRDTPDGTVIARISHGQPSVTYEPARRASRPVVDVVYAYMSSPGGLRVFDVDAKRLVKTVTGLGSYVVDGVSRDGNVVYMTAPGTAARVDLKALTAFGVNYAANYHSDSTDINSPLTAGVAIVSGMDVSPDGARAVVRFGATGVGSNGAYTSIHDGTTGAIVIDTTTLRQVRSPIRMTYRNQGVAWAPDGKRFFLLTVTPTDSGDVPGDVLGAPNSVTESMADYVTAFTADGFPTASLKLATWDIPANAGYARLPTAIAVNSSGTRLYIALQPTLLLTTSPKLAVIDISSNRLGLISFATLPAATVQSMAVSRNNAKLTLLMYDNTVLELGLANDAITVVGQTAPSPDFAINVLDGGAGRGKIIPIQNRPDPFDGNVPPQLVQFTFNKTQGVLRGYTAFSSAAKYSYDVSSYALNNRYRLASVGVRDAP